MNHTAIRKIFRDILSRKTRTFLVSASIFIGVLGVIALFTTRDLISQALDDTIIPGEIAMIDLVVNASSADPDPQASIAFLNQQTPESEAFAVLNDIEMVEGWAYYAINFKKPSATDYEKAELRAYSSPLQDAVLEPMQLNDGAWPVAGQNQVALEKRMADKYGFKIGDAIVFRTTEGEVTYTISGIIFHPYSYRGFTGDIPGPDVGIYAQYDDAQAILKFNGFNRIVLRYQTFEQAQENLAAFQQILKDNTPYVTVTPLIEDPESNAQRENANIYAGILSLLAIMTMVVSGFLVINVINTIIAEQKQQIGILKAIGSSRLETFGIYSGIALMYGVFGTLAALLPGVWVGYLITSTLAPQLDILFEDFDWSPSAVLLGVGMGLVVPILAAAVPVLNGVRISIREAVTDLGIGSQFGGGTIGKFIGTLPLPVSLRQALSNVYQKSGRLALTAITLTLTIAVFMGIVASTISVGRSVRGIFDRLEYQIVLQLNEVQSYEVVRQSLLDMPEIDQASPASLIFIEMPKGYVSFFTGDEQIQVFGIDPETKTIKFDFVEGNAWEDDPQKSGIVISSSTANKLKVEVGDTLTFTVGGQQVEREILGIDSGAFDNANMRWDELSALAGLRANAPVPNEYLLTGSVENITPTLVGMSEELLGFLADYDAENPGVVISGGMAEAAKVSAGDRLAVTIGEQTVERPILAVVPNEQLTANAAQIAPKLADIPAEVILFGFNDLVNITGVSTDGAPLPNGFYIALKDADADADETQKIMEAIEARLLEQGYAGRYTNQVAAADGFVQIAVTRTSILGAGAILIAAVGAIGLLTTLSISVLERQKEIGVMRSIGAGAEVIGFQFMMEGLIVGFIAWVIAIPLSYGAGYLLYDTLGVDPVGYRFPPYVLLIGLIGMQVIVAAASLGPSLNAARKTVSDILRYQ